MYSKALIYLFSALLCATSFRHEYEAFFKHKYIYQHTKIHGRVLTHETPPTFKHPYFNPIQVKNLNKKIKYVLSKNGIMVSEQDTVLLYDWDCLHKVGNIIAQGYEASHLAIVNSTGALLTLKSYRFANDSVLSKKFKIRQFEISNQSTENKLVLIDKDIEGVVLYFKKAK